MLQHSERGASIHLPFDFLFFHSPHMKNERRKRRSRGRSLALRERLYCMSLSLSSLSSSLFLSLLRLAFLSIITHCSLARWSTINKCKIASQRRENHLPVALLELFQPNKNKLFLQDRQGNRIRR